MNNEVVSTLGTRAFAQPGSGVRCWPGRSRPLIEIQDLNVQFVTSHGTVRAVEDLSYSVHPGEMVAIVGESGSGKSVSALAIMQLLPAAARRAPEGSVRFDGRELLELSDEEMRAHPRPGDRHDLPGADDLAQSGAEDRAADHGAAHHPSRHGRGGRARAGRSSC